MENVFKVALDPKDSERILNIENSLSKITELIKQPGPEEERWLTMKEVCKLIGFSETTVKDKVKKELLPQPHKVFTSNRWSYLEIKKWMKEQEEKSPQ